MAEMRVCSILDCAPGTMKAVTVEGKNVLIANVNGQFYCCSSECTHHGASLVEGELQGLVVSCPWHGAQFDISSGKVLTPPAPNDIQSYKINVKGNDLFVEF